MSTRERILKFINEFTVENGYSPTIREIAKAVYICSSSTIHGHLERLKKDGLITSEANSPRTIKVVAKSEDEVVKILKRHKEIPSVIEWENRRYILDMR